MKSNQQIALDKRGRIDASDMLPMRMYMYRGKIVMRIPAFEMDPVINLTNPASGSTWQMLVDSNATVTEIPEGTTVTLTQE